MNNQNEIIVCGDGTKDCKTIGEALKLANKGSVILVASGTYNETLEIDKAVTIKALDSKEKPLICCDTGCLCKITQKVILENLVLKNNTKEKINEKEILFYKNPEEYNVKGNLEYLEKNDKSKYFAIVETSAETRIIGCEILTSSGLGIISKDCKLNVKDSTITDCNVAGIYTNGGSAKIKNCKINNICSTAGIVITKNDEPPTSTIINCEICTNSHYSAGILLNSANAKIVNNKIHDSNYGIILIDSLNSKINKNKVYKTFSAAITLMNDSMADLDFNDIIDNENIGLCICNNKRFCIFIYNCYITRNAIGFFASEIDVEFNDCTLIGNKVNINTKTEDDKDNISFQNCVIDENDGYINIEDEYDDFEEETEDLSLSLIKILKEGKGFSAVQKKLQEFADESEEEFRAFGEGDEEFENTHKLLMEEIEKAKKNIKLLSEEYTDKEIQKIINDKWDDEDVDIPSEINTPKDFEVFKDMLSDDKKRESLIKDLKKRNVNESLINLIKAVPVVLNSNKSDFNIESFKKEYFEKAEKELKEDFETFDKNFLKEETDYYLNKTYLESENQHNIPKRYFLEIDNTPLPVSNPKDKNSRLKDFDIENKIFTREEANIVVAKDESGTCERITTALAMAKDGDKIFIESGIYYENVEFIHKVSICGNRENHPKICLQPLHRAPVNKEIFVDSVDFFAGPDLKKEEYKNLFTTGMIELFADSTFSNCDFSRAIRNNIAVIGSNITARFYKCYIHASGMSGIYTDYSTKIIIKDCELANNDFMGICTKESELIVEGCYIHHMAMNIPEENIHIEGTGISCDNTKAIIKNCVFKTLFNSAVESRRNSDVTIENSIITQGKYFGTKVYLGSKLTMSKCVVNHIRDIGIFVEDDGQAKIEDCKIINCIKPSFRSCGILVQKAGKATIKNSTISNIYGTGVQIYGRTSVKINGCTIKNIKESFTGTATGIAVDDLGKLNISDSKIFDVSGNGIIGRSNSKTTANNLELYNFKKSNQYFPSAVILTCAAKASFTDCNIHHMQNGFGFTSMGGEKSVLTNVKVSGVSEKEKYIFDPVSMFSRFQKVDVPDYKKIEENNFEIKNGKLLKVQALNMICELPDTVKEITVESFEGEENKDIEKLYIPSSVKTINLEAFYPLTELLEYKVAEDNPYFKNYNKMLFTKDMTTLFAIPSDIRTLYIPETVKSINVEAYIPVKRLSYIKVSEDNPYYSSILGELYSKDGTVLYKHPMSKNTIHFSSKLKTIAESAFDNLDDINTIRLPEGITTIEPAAFINSFSLETLSLPMSLREIGEYAFYNSGIEEILIMPGIKVIPNHAFFECENLLKIKIPHTVEVIEERAFDGCYALESIKLENGLKRIEDFAFAHCTSLFHIEIPESVTSISDKAFCLCPNITKIKVSENNNSYIVENGLLMDKAKKTLLIAEKERSSIKIPNTIEKINSEAFANSFNLKGPIILPESLKEIKTFAFGHCSQITSITIPSKVKVIEYLTFMNCKALKEVSLPDSLKSIEFGAFTGCKKLKNINLPSSLEKIEEECFKDCSSLSEIVIPEGVKTLEKKCFQNCTGLKSITLPSTLEYIDLEAFKGCNNPSVKISKKHKYFFKDNYGNLISKKTCIKINLK